MTNKIAIKIFEYVLGKHSDNVGITVYPNLQEERAAIKFAIKALEEKEADRWVPVSERLPEEGNKTYLTTVDYGNGLISSCQRFFYNDEIGWNDEAVIAWKPMPEAYKENDNEQA